MTKRNSVFIATSLDGFIADKNGGIDWLHSVPNPDGVDMGYGEFMASVDALLMGRNTFDIVCGFDIEWPYKQPVFVLSNTLSVVPEKLKGKVQFVKGSLKDILATIHKLGYNRLYIDGGKTIQGFLKEDLIDDLTITVIPVILGGGSPLFADQDESLNFECTDTKIFLNKVVQNHFRRSKDNVNLNKV